MSLAIRSQHDGLIRFYRTRARDGHRMFAVFAPDPALGHMYRNALVPDGYYDEVSVSWVRRFCTPADETDARDMREALVLLEQIDQRGAYVRELERTAQ